MVHIARGFRVEGSGFRVFRVLGGWLRLERGKPYYFGKPEPQMLSTFRLSSPKPC